MTEQERAAALKLADDMEAEGTLGHGWDHEMCIKALHAYAARPAAPEVPDGWVLVPATQDAAANFSAECEAGPTWWQKGRDRQWFEGLSDVDLAEEAGSLADILNDGDFDYLDAFAPVQGLISLLAERLDATARQRPAAPADLWTSDLFADEEMDEVGLTRSEFPAALQYWSFMQNRPTTVGDAALAFNTTLDVIRDAVEQHEWMFIGAGDGAAAIIEHEGE